jgi:PleD family two-component response regulator
MDKNVYLGLKSGGLILGLVSTMEMATRVGKMARQSGMVVHNCSEAAALVSHARKSPPLFVILDWDGCESEAFKVLKEFAQDADLKKVPIVGCVSKEKEGVRSAAEKAGCDRVYFKSEFNRVLGELFIRYCQ